MAIIAPQTALNGGVGNYHKIQRIEIAASALEPEPRVFIMIGFYASEQARDEFPEYPLFQRTISMTITQMVEAGLSDPRDMFYKAAMLDPAFAGTNAKSDVTDLTSP